VAVVAPLYTGSLSPDRGQLILGGAPVALASPRDALARGIGLPANPIIDSGVDVVTAANVDQYVIGWKALEKQ
jgi:hypothetical protein